MRLRFPNVLLELGFRLEIPARVFINQRIAQVVCPSRKISRLDRANAHVRVFDSWKLGKEHLNKIQS